MKFRLDEQSLIETLEDAKKYYPNISQEDFDRVIAIDPTFNRAQDKLGTYGKWLLKMFSKKALNDESKTKELLVDFDANKNNLKDKDIMKYTSVEDLENMLNDENSYKELSRRQSLRQVQKKVHKTDVEQDAQKVFENNNWIVYVPKTYEASCKLGRGTQWCTATTENDYYYKRYTDKGKLYININKKNPEEKYQFHFETKSYMNEKDDPIDIIDFFVDNPDLFKFYRTVISDSAESKNGWKVIPAISFVLDNPSDTFIYSIDNAESFEKYGVFLRRKLKHLIIDKSISIIPSSLCSTFPYLQSVDMPDGITSIGWYAFSGCISLKSITIPDSVTSIGEGAFSGCTALSDINIPKNVYEIGPWAFSGCFIEALRIQGESIDIGQGAFFDSSLKSVTIVGDDVNIQNSAFASCKSLITVDMKGVTKIGESAFDGCSSLTSVTISDSVTSIGEGAFEFCSSLTSITMGDSVTSIGWGAFYKCSSLESITIPDSVTSIGDRAFQSCKNLKEVYYKGTKKQWDSIDISDGNNSLFNANIIFNSLKESVDTIKKQSNIPTEEQEDYFWASQVRDRQGNLLVCYHSSNTAREILNPRDTFVWFSVSEGYSKKYGSNTVACYLDITKPFIIGDTSVWFENKNRLLSINVNVDGREYKIKPSDAVIAIAKRLNISVKTLCEIQVRACALKDDDYKGYVLEFVNTPEFAKIVKDAGYDGIQTIEQGHLCFGTLYKDQAKAITNKAPTGEPSIYE